jgi:hypothetical protein
MMVMKCVRKQMVVVMMLILILLDVQANDLASTSFSLSSPPIMLPYSFELDEATGATHKCIADKIEGCPSSKRIWPFPDSEYEICVIGSLRGCFLHFYTHVDPPIYKVVMKRIMACVKANCPWKMRWIHIRARARLSSCILECSEEGTKGHLDVIYTQNS